MGTLEQMGYLGGLHPSVFEGEFEAIACTNVWLDIEQEHGDTSEASRRFVPLAWLAAELLEAVARSSDDAKLLNSWCCQAAQLLDPERGAAGGWPVGRVGQFETLRVPLLELAKDGEQSVFGKAADSDAEEQTPEPGVDGLRVHIIEYSRHPQSLRRALLGCESLMPCRRSLHDRGFSPEFPSGAKIFVPAEFYEAVVVSLQGLEGVYLKPWHVIVSEDFETAVVAAAASLPSREQVRMKNNITVECPPICEQCAAPTPRFSCSRCGVARYCTRECQKMHWQLHSKACMSDEAGSLTLVSKTFIHVHLPSSLRSGPSSCQKTASTSDANPRVLRNPRKA